MIPGEMLVDDGDVEINAGRETVKITVANSGDRPVQVGSHYHFFETNPALAFDRRGNPWFPPQHTRRDGGAFRAGTGTHRGARRLCGRSRASTGFAAR